MSSADANRVTGLSGRVVQGHYGKGTKSERQAIFIETSDARYILRRKSGPAFGDKELTQYVGEEVICDGFVIGSTFWWNELRE